jgi:hypothetical protein
MVPLLIPTGRPAPYPNPLPRPPLAAELACPSNGRNSSIVTKWRPNFPCFPVPVDGVSLDHDYVLPCPENCCAAWPTRKTSMRGTVRVTWSRSTSGRASILPARMHTHSNDQTDIRRSILHMTFPSTSLVCILRSFVDARQFAAFLVHKCEMK